MTSRPTTFPVTAVATGVGSLPGSDPSEAARVVGGELAELAHVPELPMRGPWADMTGRACALLVDLPAELTVDRWQLTDRPGRDRARARSLLSQDLDALEEVLQASDASLKVQVCGPLTLASTVELRTGERVLADRAAIADLTASLAEGVAIHLTDVRQRFPNVPCVLVQIDEPAAVAVVRGSIPTASGYRRLPAVTPSFAKQCVDKVAAAARSADARAMVHICANDPPIDLVAAWGIEAISCPVGELRTDKKSIDDFAAFFDRGGVWFAGLNLSDLSGSLANVRGIMTDAGVGASRLADHVNVTPPCGLGDGSMPQATTTYSSLVTAAQELHDDRESA